VGFSVCEVNISSMKKKENRFSKTRLRRQAERPDSFEAKAPERVDSINEPERKGQKKSPGLSSSEEQALWGE
jgi:hypothetical protein